jgi:hypothetical protein
MSRPSSEFRLDRILARKVLFSGRHHATKSRGESKTRRRKAMATKKNKKSSTRVRSLKAKGLTSKQAKGVKGGTENVTRSQVSASGDGSVNKLINIRGKEPAY